MQNITFLHVCNINNINIFDKLFTFIDDDIESYDSNSVMDDEESEVNFYYFLLFY